MNSIALWTVSPYLGSYVYDRAVEAELGTSVALAALCEELFTGGWATIADLLEQLHDPSITLVRHRAVSLVALAAQLNI